MGESHRQHCTIADDVVCSRAVFIQFFISAPYDSAGCLAAAVTGSLWK